MGKRARNKYNFYVIIAASLNMFLFNSNWIYFQILLSVAFNEFLIV